jgi:hypothetical protein
LAPRPTSVLDHVSDASLFARRQDLFVLGWELVFFYDQRDEEQNGKGERPRSVGREIVSWSIIPADLNFNCAISTFHSRPRKIEDVASQDEVVAVLKKTLKGADVSTKEKKKKSEIQSSKQTKKWKVAWADIC